MHTWSTWDVARSTYNLKGSCLGFCRQQVVAHVCSFGAHVDNNRKKTPMPIDEGGRRFFYCAELGFIALCEFRPHFATDVFSESIVITCLVY
jgi:hypothetical protein